jgi:hypothetical protein
VVAGGTKVGTVKQEVPPVTATQLFPWVMTPPSGARPGPMSQGEVSPAQVGFG